MKATLIIVNIHGLYAVDKKKRKASVPEARFCGNAS